MATKVPGLSHSFEFHEVSRAWSPNQFSTGLELIGCSVPNVVSFLETSTGTSPSEVQFSWPNDPEVFDRAIHDDNGPIIRHMTFTEALIAARVREPSRADVLAWYAARVAARRPGHSAASTPTPSDEH